MVKEGLSEGAAAPIRSWLVAAPAACFAWRDGPARADALVLDIAADLDAALLDRVRRAVAVARRGMASGRVFARLGALDDGPADRALDAIMRAAPDGIVLADCRGPADVQRLGAKLAVREAERGMPDGAMRIVAVAGSAAALLAAGSLRDASPRLCGVGWDAGALAAQLAPGRPAPAAALAHARALTVVAARAAGVVAIDSLSHAAPVAFADECAASWRDGFDGKFAASPAQAAAIDTAFGR